MRHTTGWELSLHNYLASSFVLATSSRLVASKKKIRIIRYIQKQLRMKGEEGDRRLSHMNVKDTH